MLSQRQVPEHSTTRVVVVCVVIVIVCDVGDGDAMVGVVWVAVGGLVSVSMVQSVIQGVGRTYGTRGKHPSYKHGPNSYFS